MIDRSIDAGSIKKPIIGGLAPISTNQIACEVAGELFDLPRSFICSVTNHGLIYTRTETIAYSDGNLPPIPVK